MEGHTNTIQVNNTWQKCLEKDKIAFFYNKFRKLEK